MTVTNPHSAASEAALVRFKELVDDLDSWTFTGEQEGVKIYNQHFEGSPIPAFRGDTVFLGHKYTPHQILAVANSPGCRKYWDDKFDDAEIKEIYSRYETLFWAKTKAPWPIYPRDMAATLLREYKDDECSVVMTSVEDERIPEVAGNVRATLIVSGWKVFKTDEGVGITYITQIDLAGYIPTSFLKTIEQQIPLCVGKVAQYVEEFGFPPHNVGGSAGLTTENFDNENKVYTATFSSAGNDAEYTVSNTMYPNGVDVQVTGGAKVSVTKNEGVASQVYITDIEASSTLEIKGK